MKKLLFVSLFASVEAFAGGYQCSGAGFNIEVLTNPSEMYVVGNGYDAQASNVKIESLFDTVVTGNFANPPSTFRLMIKDSAGMVGNLKISTGNGVKEFKNLACVKN